MMLLRLIRIFAFILVLPNAGAARAQDAMLFQPFDATLLSTEEKKLLQTLLAFEGRYNGLLEGSWGPRSQAALDAWTAEELDSPSTTFLDVGALVLSSIDGLARDGWAIRYFEPMDISLLVPEEGMTAPVLSPSGTFINFSHHSSSIQYSLAPGDPDFVRAMHRYTEDAALTGTTPYTVRRAQTWITSSRLANGRTLYTRSDLVSSGWSTVMVSGLDADAGIMAAVTGSIAKGRASPLGVPDDGLLRRVVLATADALSEQSPSNPEPAVTPPHTTQKTGRSSGTGFYVDEAGSVLTNRHVVESCSGLTVDGSTAILRSVSPDYDLAILATAPVGQEKVVSFSALPERLNSDVTVIGFPLAGVLGGLNVTRGSVSGERGFGGDPIQMQITAPVQPGNSGGPVVSEAGDVVGVVVSKLNAVAVMESVGDVPQNVNFAIRGDFAKLFLVSEGITPKVASGSTRLSSEDLADRLRRSTVFIECF